MASPFDQPMQRRSFASKVGQALSGFLEAIGDQEISKKEGVGWRQRLDHERTMYPLQEQAGRDANEAASRRAQADDISLHVARQNLAKQAMANLADQMEGQKDATPSQERIKLDGYDMNVPSAAATPPNWAGEVTPEVAGASGMTPEQITRGAQGLVGQSKRQMEMLRQTGRLGLEDVRQGGANTRLDQTLESRLAELKARLGAMERLSGARESGTDARAGTRSFDAKVNDAMTLIQRVQMDRTMLPDEKEAQVQGILDRFGLQVDILNGQLVPVGRRGPVAPQGSGEAPRPTGMPAAGPTRTGKYTVVSVEE